MISYLGRWPIKQRKHLNDRQLTVLWPTLPWDQSARNRSPTNKSYWLTEDQHLFSTQRQHQGSNGCCRKSSVEEEHEPSFLELIIKLLRLLISRDAKSTILEKGRFLLYFEDFHSIMLLEENWQEHKRMDLVKWHMLCSIMPTAPLHSRSPVTG
ncbi:hypothetical protein chiPu_0012429 [Chiloscyllium punctatum]|uniref:Uncharacterized protein n=1 Tax=Chiloscyllium punctatum TaxID=137246 RepID=A0A401SUA6_CHIPU|nr:hypothetical protein [Chiloscyllium punctatum]